MLDLKELLKAIHDSVVEAGASLRAQNLQILDDYFEPVPDSEGLDALADRLSRVSGDLAGDADPQAASASLQQALKAMEGAAAALKEDAKQGVSKGQLQPKMVALQFPHVDADGPKAHPVLVPLIALTPASTLQLSNLRFTTDLEIEEVDGRLRCGFPQKRSSGAATSPSGPAVPGDPQAADAKSPPSSGPHRATLDIEIRADQPPRGLEVLLEGYHRALRAQIPG